jgi:hypothetical protein
LAERAAAAEVARGHGARRGALASAELDAEQLFVLL